MSIIVILSKKTRKFFRHMVKNIWRYRVRFFMGDFNMRCYDVEAQLQQKIIETMMVPKAGTSEIDDRLNVRASHH